MWHRRDTRLGHAASPWRVGGAPGVTQRVLIPSLPACLHWLPARAALRQGARSVRFALPAVPCKRSHSTPGPVAVGFEVVRESTAALVTRPPIPRQAGRWLARLQCPSLRSGHCHSKPAGAGHPTGAHLATALCITSMSQAHTHQGLSEALSGTSVMLGPNEEVVVRVPPTLSTWPLGRTARHQKLKGCFPAGVAGFAFEVGRRSAL